MVRYNFAKVNNMGNTYTAVTKQDGDWWIGWIEEIPGVNCQERTRPELVASLRTTLAEALEFNRQDALRAAAPGYTEELVTV
jgi:predicted RNase H-like HicB family nuclease